MKRLCVLWMALVAFVACSDESAVTLSPDGGELITIGVGVEEQMKSRVTSDYGGETGGKWGFAWESGDYIYAVSASGSAVKMEMDEFDEELSTFTLNSANVESGTSYRLLYNGNQAISDLKIDMSSQDGTLDQTYMESGFYSGAELLAGGVNSTMTHVGSYAKVKVTLTNMPDDCLVSKIVIGGLNMKATYQPITGDSNSILSNVENGEITITPSVDISESTTLYANMLPISFSAGDEVTKSIYFDNDSYYKYTSSITSASTVDRGQFCTINITCDCDNTSRIYEFANGNYDKDVNDKTYTISTRKHLESLAALANNGVLRYDNGCTFELLNDIDLQNKSWCPIGCYSDGDDYYFKGTFDGKGYSVKGLNVDSNVSYMGLFGYVASGATLKNVVVDGSISVGSAGTVNAIGGLAGIVHGGEVVDCGSNVAITLGYDYVKCGGLVGWVNNDGNLLNSYNTGNITSSGLSVDVGGLCGNLNLSTSLNCYSAGAVTSTGAKSNVGAFLGSCNNVEVSYCYCLVGDGVNVGLESIGSGSASGVTAESTKSAMYSLDEMLNYSISLDAVDDVTAQTIYKWKFVSGSYPIIDYNNKYTK